MSKPSITATTTPDGAIIVTRNGRTKRVAPAKPTNVSPVEIERAARADRDNPPLSGKSLARLTPVPRVKTLRRALSLTQEEFAARYRIPIGTLRDWEQGRSQPDQPARAYLTVIARDPDGVRKSLAREKV